MTQVDSTIFPSSNEVVITSADDLFIALDNEAGTLVRVDTIDAAVNDFGRIYENVTPFEVIPTLGGLCYKWSDEFIYNCLLAMATDKLTQFSEEELQAWYSFVNFENYHSTSARDTDANGTAIGCTIPNTLNESYVVAGDGTILNGLNNNKKELCQPPSYEIESEAAWKSLDEAFMSIYNCQEINNCNIDDTVDIQPCPTN